MPKEDTFMTTMTLKKTLQRAITYWNEGEKGNHSNLSILNYIANEVSNLDKIDYSKLDKEETDILNKLNFIANIKEKLQEAESYWQEAFDGNHTNSSTLSYIADCCKKADKNIDRTKLAATERLVLNNLLILSNCR